MCCLPGFPLGPGRPGIPPGVPIEPFLQGSPLGPGSPRDPEVNQNVRGNWGPAGVR